MTYDQTMALAFDDELTKIGMNPGMARLLEAGAGAAPGAAIGAMADKEHRVRGGLIGGGLGAAAGLGGGALLRYARSRPFQQAVEEAAGREKAFSGLERKAEEGLASMHAKNPPSGAELLGMGPVKPIERRVTSRPSAGGLPTSHSPEEFRSALREEAGHAAKQQAAAAAEQQVHPFGIGAKQHAPTHVPHRRVAVRVVDPQMRHGSTVGGSL